MKFNFSYSSIFISIFILFITVLSCRSETEEIVNSESILLENGKLLEIEKTDRNTSSIGIFSNHNYGVTHQYSYQLTLDDDIDWIGGSHEPKQILYHNEDVYIRFLQKKRYTISWIDSLTQENKSSFEYRIEPGFQKHIDERYFFKLFGKDYWVNIDSNRYYFQQKDGKEYDIPNDGELIRNQY
ncbi:MAG: hypothetical protein ACPG6V_11445 [Flavobacteriales bacterium]